MPNIPQYLSTAEVAEAKGVDVRTIHRMVERGELTPVIKGKGIRGPMWFTPDVLEDVAS